MIVCPACRAENPDGTKICVKCATELPKVAGAAGVKKDPAAAAVPSKGFGMKDMGKDLFDFLWLLLIILLILFGFIGQATQWTFHFRETEAAKIVTEPVIAKPAPRPQKRPKKIAIQKEPEPIGEQPAVQFGSAETFYEKGKKQYDSRRYQSSFGYLKQALEVDPTFAKAYFGLGYLYSRFDMSDAAVRMYEMALRFNPDHVDTINNLAMMYFHAGNFDDAQVLLQKAVVLDSQNADCEYNLGSVYLEKNQPYEALPAFERAAALRPNDAAIYNNMALTYERLGRKQEAQDSWQKVMQYSTDANLLQQAKTHLDFLQTQG